MNTSTQIAPLLEASDLTVRFGKVTALDSLNLVAPPGDVVAILGPNGAGKTTFVRTIATLIEPSSGTLQVRGNDVLRNPLAVRRDIGLAGQYAAVEPTMTGRENLVTDVVLTTHYLDEANELADQVVIIDHGKAIASGTLGDLKASVGRDIIEVAPANSSRLEAVGQILRNVTEDQVRVDHSGRRANASTNDGTNQLAATIQRLDEAAIAVDEIGLRRPTLDEVFLALTGESAGTPATVGATQGGGAR
jgi:ABC-type multidrug transport system ATPase subunit